MSIAMMTAVWGLELPDSEKLVLLALADSGDDKGKCWPSMATLTRKCSKSERTVQTVIKSLVGKRYLARLEKPGRGVIYRVYPAGDAPDVTDPRNARTPATAAPPHRLRPAEIAGTPAAVAGKPSMNHNPPDKADALSTPGGSAARKSVSEKRKKSSGEPSERKRPIGSRLAEDWQAPPTSELSQPVQAIVAQWPAGAYELTAIQFRNHWRSEGRAVGAKRDWGATWENWLMRESPHILRAARAGQRFDAGAKPVTASPAETAAVTAVRSVKAEEGSGPIRDMRARLKAAIGTASYDGWVKDTAFRVEGGALICTAPTAFKASWIEQHFSGAIGAAAVDAGVGQQMIRFEAIKVHVCRTGEQAKAA